MTVKHGIRLWPENRIVVRIKAVSTHHYFAISNWWFRNEGFIRSGDKIFPIKEESPNLAICCTNVPYKNGFSDKAIVNPKFNMPPSMRNLSKSSFVSTAVISISSY
jgi:hypothetical protein